MRDEWPGFYREILRHLNLATTDLQNLLLRLQQEALPAEAALRQIELSLQELDEIKRLPVPPHPDESTWPEDFHRMHGLVTEVLEREKLGSDNQKRLERVRDMLHKVRASYYKQ